PRHEKFAQLVFAGLADGVPRIRAYMAAGYTKNYNAAEASAARLWNCTAARIAERVAELQQEVATGAGETVEKIAGELNEILYEARADKAHSAAVAAAQAKAKLLGLQVERTEIGPPNAFTPQSTDDIADALLKEVGAPIITDDMREQAK